MFIAKRPFVRLMILLLLLATFALTSCSRGAIAANWPGMSSDGENIYVAYGNGVLGLEAATQDLLWSFKPENAALFFYAPPSVENGRAVIGDFGAAQGLFSPRTVVSIYGLDVTSSTPSTLWVRDDSASDRIVAAPIQVDGVAYVATADNLLLALEGETGEELWRFPTEFSIWAKPTYYEGTIFVASLDRFLYAVNAEDGSEIWSVELSGAMSASPVVNPEANLVYAASYDREVHAIDIDSGEEVWSVSATDWVWSAPALADGNLYFGDSSGNVFAVNAADGEVLWESGVHSMNTVAGVAQNPPAQIKGAIQASPVVQDGVVYVASLGNEESEEGLLVALDAANGDELWQVTTPAPLFSDPVIIGEEIIIALQSEVGILQAYDLGEGRLSWSYQPPE
ncbi:MAG: PQQ-binding-like beta-propeller repeat protein [Ardenticatenaceae bacterium]|nr:PQQ-binding-like beta-propeller repeat protein [Ardenticatenaceae bacterium]MCB8948364.1 PQQ-binding-like beta-propeller repeat protein [Ardenticatenaceae bacterium]